MKIKIFSPDNNEVRSKSIGNIKNNFNQNERQNGLSIIILNINKPELIIPLVKDLIEMKKKFEANNFNMEIIIGDTGSSDLKVLDFYEEKNEDIIVAKNLKYHFSKNNNELFNNFSNYNKILFLNNDIIFKANGFNTLQEMLTFIESDEKVGIIGSTLFYEDGAVQHIGQDFFMEGPLKGLSYHPYHMQYIKDLNEGSFINIFAVTGSFIMIRSELFELVNGFDEIYSMECQDVDLCLNIKRLGYNVYIYSSQNILHLENSTREKGEENYFDRNRFVRRWRSFIEGVLK